jgi:hypothetical protein
MSDTTKDGCNDCNKSLQSILFLRPSPVAKDKALAPKGSEAVVDSAALAQGFLPERLPTESRTALRLLRAGYLYIYIASPPAGMKNWLVHRITDNADMIAQTNALFSVMPEPAACSRNGHNAMGMRLVGLPGASQISSIWVAYSANLWSDPLKAHNAANPSVMQEVPLNGSHTAHTFAPTEANLKSKVLECALPSSAFDATSNNDFAFVNIRVDTAKLADTLTQAAACHPKTKGHEIAVVLADPVGYASELNALRLRRYEMAKREVEKPENAHPLNSSQTLLGMKKTVGDVRGLNNLAPLISRQSYENLKRQGGPRIQAASWEPIGLTPGCAPVAASLGRLWYAGQKDKLAEQSAQFGQQAWKQIQGAYDESARAAWQAGFDKTLQTQHLDVLERYEMDWLTSCEGSRCKAYFAQHFDENDPNKALQLVSPGHIYALESSRIHTPAPLSTGGVLSQYIALQNKPITDTGSVILRAMVGNQKSVIKLVSEQLLGDPNEAGMRDKTVDLIKGLISDVGGEQFKQRYSWLSNVVCRLALLHINATSSAIMAWLTVTNTITGPDAGKHYSRIKSLALLGASLEQSLQASLGKKLAIPILLYQHVSLEKASQLLGQPNRVSTGGSTMLTLLTDTQAIKAAGGNTDALFQQAAKTDPSKITSGSAASSQIGQAAGKTLAVPVATVAASYASQGAVFDTLYAQQQAQLERLKGSLRQAGNEGAKTLFNSVDGRLAMAGVMVQVIGLMRGLAAVETAQADVQKASQGKSGADQSKAKDALHLARMGLYDSMGGVLGSLMDSARIGGEAMSLSRQSAGKGTPLPKNVPLNALRFGVQIVGVFGGVLNGYVSFIKFGEAYEQKNLTQASLYFISGTASFGTAVTSLALTSGVAAEFIVARQIGSAGLQRVATQVAVRVGTGVVAEAAVAAGAATFAGVVGTAGLVLLGIAVVTAVGAVLVSTPPLVEWTEQSYFGKGNKKFPKGDWPAEQEALYKALGMAAAQAQQETGQADVAAHPATAGGQSCPA